MLINHQPIYAIKAGKSRIHGTGAYALEAIPARKKIGSMSGRIVSKRAANKIVKESKDKTFALVELWNGEVLDGSVNANALRYINHSCGPNTYLRVNGYHVEFYALHDIAKGEELTCDYGPTHHDGQQPCGCGSVQCRGFI